QSVATSGADRYIGDRRGEEAGAAAQIQRRPDDLAGQDGRMSRQFGTPQTRDPIAKRYEMRLAAILIPVQHRLQILGWSTRRTRQNAGGCHEMPDIRVVGPELQ